MSRMKRVGLSGGLLCAPVRSRQNGQNRGAENPEKLVIEASLERCRISAASISLSHGVV